MTDTQTNFLGIPVHGTITRGTDRVDQRPIEELQPIMQAVLDDPTIVEFGWRQWTPYFNDGEPCEFGVSEIWVRTVDDAEDADRYDLEFGSSHPTLGRVRGEWVDDPKTHRQTYEITGYEGPDRARYDRAQALNKAIAGGAFEHVLLDAFGDHARVTVRRTGIEIEFYDHD